MDIRAADLKAMQMMSSIVYILLLLVTHTLATSPSPSHADFDCADTKLRNNTPAG